MYNISKIEVAPPETNGPEARIRGKIKIVINKQLKNFIFYAVGYFGNGWHVTRIENTDKDFIPREIFMGLANYIEEVLNKEFKPKIKLNCDLQIGNGKTDTGFGMGSGIVDMGNGKINIKNKGNMMMIGDSKLEFNHRLINNNLKNKHMEKIGIVLKFWSFIKNLFKPKSNINITGANVESGGKMDMRDQASINVNVNEKEDKK